MLTACVCTVVVVVLVAAATAETPKVVSQIPLCCDEQHTWNPKSSSCVPWEERVPSAIPEHMLRRIGFPTQDYRFRIRTGFPNCTNGFIQLDPESDPADDFKITSSGDLVIHGFNNHKESPDTYCLLWFKPEGQASTTLHPLVCFDEILMPKRSDVGRAIKQILYPMALGISDFFFFLTFLVFALLPELRDVYGRCVMSNVACLFFGYMFLILLNTAVTPANPVGCIIVGFGMYLSFMAAFFWLNVISFHVFITARMSTLGAKEPLRWICYCLYAWGSAFICFLVLIGVEFSLDLGHPLKPTFKVMSCWFSSDLPMSAFFYGPIAVILFVNAILYILTASTLFRITKEETSATHKITFKLYLKMFFIMGFTWLFELIGFKLSEETKKYWYVQLSLDLLNLFQGVLIFVIMVCKKRVWELLKVRYLGITAPSAEMEMRDSVI